MKERNCHYTAVVIGTLFAELGPALRAGFTYPLGWKKHFNFYNLNPKTLTDEQSESSAILLLPGSLHNQSAWLALAKKLRDEGIGPVYTVNLKSVADPEKDQEIIDKKIKEIQEQYKEKGVELKKIHLIGHSRGGAAAFSYMLRDEWEEGESPLKESIGKVIKLGNVIDEMGACLIGLEHRGQIYELLGEKDVLLQEESEGMEIKNRSIVPEGHVGLLYSREGHKQIVKWLRE